MAQDVPSGSPSRKPRSSGTPDAVTISAYIEIMVDAEGFEPTTR